MKNELEKLHDDIKKQNIRLREKIKELQEKTAKNILRQRERRINNLKKLNARISEIEVMLKKGKSYAEVGKQLGISRQRVHQLITRGNKLK